MVKIAFNNGSKDMKNKMANPGVILVRKKSFEGQRSKEKGERIKGKGHR